MSERELLSKWFGNDVAKKEIARRLSRDIKTIRREIKRNSTRVTVGRNDWQIIYEPLHAHSVAMDRKQKAFNAKHPLKNPDVYSYVLDNLRGGWSPEEISGRLREQEHRGILTGRSVWKQYTSSYTKIKLIRQNKDYIKRES